MLKEKLYAEYQKLFEDYKKKHKLVDSLEDKLVQLRKEKEEARDKIENQKEKDLQYIKDQKQELKKQLSSIKKEGENSKAVQEYSALKLAEIKDKENYLQNLKEYKEERLEGTRNTKKNYISRQESKKKEYQSKLNDAMNLGSGISPLKTFDENKLRQQLKQNRENEVNKLTSQYDNDIFYTQTAIQGIDEKYEGILEQQISDIEGDMMLSYHLKTLNERLNSKELPASIMDTLNKDVEEVVSQYNLKDSRDIAEVGARAIPLDNLGEFTPVWLINLVEVGFPLLTGLGVFLFFWLSGVQLGFVATATNAVASFLLWIVGACIGFGILYGICRAVKGQSAGVIGGIAGGIIGFMIVCKFGVDLPYGFTNAVEWIVKVIICIAGAAGVFFLNGHTVVGTALTNLGMKLGFVKKQALASQGAMIEHNIISYFIILKYKEIINCIVENNKKNEKEELEARLLRLQAEKDPSVEALKDRLDKEAERRLSSEKVTADASEKQYEKEQTDLIQLQDQYMLEIARCDEDIQEARDKFDKEIKEYTLYYDTQIAETRTEINHLKERISGDKDSLLAQVENDISECDREYLAAEKKYEKRLADSDKEYESKLKEVQGEIDKKNKEFSSDLEVLHDLYKKFDNETVGFKESQGVLSDYIYLSNDTSTSKEDPKTQTAIKHDKKPIVFLYDVKDSTNVSEALYEFMRAVLAGFLRINAMNAIDFVITDPVTKARKFESMAGILTIENDIRKLSESIQTSIGKVAKTGMHIDEYNRKMCDEGEDEKKFCKYKIVEFIVPEEEDPQNTNFFDSDLWGALRDGSRYGFIPVFYIKYDDWKNTFDDESKLNSKFIRQLKNAIGTSNGSVFKIDIENITIKKLDK